jgi:hypothetical protein
VMRDMIRRLSLSLSFSLWRDLTYIECAYHTLCYVILPLRSTCHAFPHAPPSCVPSHKRPHCLLNLRFKEHLTTAAAAARPRLLKRALQLLDQSRRLCCQSSAQTALECRPAILCDVAKPEAGDGVFSPIRVRTRACCRSERPNITKQDASCRPHHYQRQQLPREISAQKQDQRRC